MARRKDGNRYWIYGEDAAPAAQFTAYLSKVLKNRRANYIRQKSAEQEKETSFDELEETAAQQDGGAMEDEIETCLLWEAKDGKVDRVYICRMRQVSGKECRLYSFFKRLMQYGVQVTATEYSLRDRANMFRLARRVERYATRKGLRLPW